MATVEYGPEKAAKQVGVLPKIGWYAYENDRSELNWLRCRENFASAFTSTINGIYFSHPAGDGDKVAHFITRMEDTLMAVSCESFEHTKFSKCNLNFALWIEPSEYWKMCEMRRSLFTILLRCGLKYDSKIDNFEEALYSDQYIAGTKDAIQRFLFGFTRYVKGKEKISGIGKGWYSYFTSLKPEDIRAKLIPPPGVEIESCLVGTGSLWT